MKLTYLLLILFKVSNSSRILAIFPAPAISHQIVYRTLVGELLKSGHEVTIITTDPQYRKNQTPLNLTQVDIHDISYKTLYEKLQAKNTTRVKTTFETASYVFEEQLKSSEVQSILKSNTHFDLLLIELCVHPALVFSYFYKAPVILISSFGGVFDTFEGIGAATHPFLYPLPLRRRVYCLSMWEKVTELMLHLLQRKNYDSLVFWEDEMLKRVVGPDVPSLKELRKNVDMYFLNTYAMWDSNRPVPPNVVYLGGLHIAGKIVKKLPKSLEECLNSSIGAIYTSFGTNVDPSTFPPEKIKIFTRIFSRMPYTVLWKWDKDELPGQSKNILTSKWFPQADLLHHPKIKLFITQAGLQSTDEAISAGVPLLGIPMIGDQFYNAEKYEHFKIGLKMDFESIYEDNLQKAIDKLIYDERYRKNIKKLHRILSDNPQTPLDRAVWWTEYVLRHRSGKHLQAAGAHLSWTEYYEIQLSLVLLFIVILLVSFSFIHS